MRHHRAGKVHRGRRAGRPWVLLRAALARARVRRVHPRVRPTARRALRRALSLRRVGRDEPFGTLRRARGDETEDEPDGEQGDGGGEEIQPDPSHLVVPDADDDAAQAVPQVHRRAVRVHALHRVHLIPAHEQDVVQRGDERRAEPREEAHGDEDARVGDEGGDGEERHVAAQRHAERRAAPQHVAHGPDDHVSQGAARVLRGGDRARPRRRGARVHVEALAQKIRQRGGEERHAEVIRQRRRHPGEERVREDRAEGGEEGGGGRGVGRAGGGELPGCHPRDRRRRRHARSG